MGEDNIAVSFSERLRSIIINFICRNRTLLERLVIDVSKVIPQNQTVQSTYELRKYKWQKGSYIFIMKTP